MRRADDPRLQPVVWIVILGAAVLVIVSADSRGELLAQGGVFGIFLAIYVVLLARTRRR
jgi:hypothetical protein